MKVDKYSVNRVSIGEYSMDGTVQKVHVEFDAEVSSNEFRAIFDMLESGHISERGKHD
jgi:hypothetical protein